MNIQQFIATWQNKKVPSRGGITGQCVSLVQQWAQVNGIGGTPVFPVSSAYQMPNSRNDAFTWITNTPTGVPAPGDIVVWNNKVGGGHGHTGVVVSANTKTLDVFQQNDPMGSGAYTKRYNYTNVMGWLKFKQVAQPPKGVIMDTNAGRELYRTGLFREPENDSAGSAAQWNGRPPAEALKVLRDSPEWQANATKLKAYDTLSKQVSELSARPTKAELDAVVTNLKLSEAKVSELEKQVIAEQANETEAEAIVQQGQSWLQKLLNWRKK